MIQLYLKRYFWLITLGSVLLGIFVPQAQEIFRGKESFLLMGILFFNLLGLSVKDMTNALKRPINLLWMTLVINAVSGALIYIYRDYFNADTLTGLLLAVTSGVSVAGLLISNIFIADKAKNFILIIVTSVVSALIIPYILPQTEVNSFDLMLQMGKFMIVPIFFAGLFRLSSYGEYIEKHGSYFSILLFAILIYSTVSATANFVLIWPIALIALAFTLLNIFFGLVIGKNRQEKIAFSAGTILRNYEIPLAIAISSFSPDTAVVIVVFMIVSYLAMTPVLYFASKR